MNAEKTFYSSFRQSGGNCENTMKSLFGTENQRPAEKVLVEQATFYEGKNFEAILRLEMCDECEWKWINLNFWIEGRGPGFKQPQQKRQGARDYKNTDSSEFEGLIAAD